MSTQLRAAPKVPPEQGRGAIKAAAPLSSHQRVKQARFAVVPFLGAIHFTLPKGTWLHLPPWPPQSNRFLKRKYSNFPNSTGLLQLKDQSAALAWHCLCNGTKSRHRGRQEHPFPPAHSFQAVTAIPVTHGHFSPHHQLKEHSNNICCWTWQDPLSSK